SPHPVRRTVRAASLPADTAESARTGRPHLLRDCTPQGEDEDMKYFTPELIAMGHSEDDRVLNEQERLWEEAGDRYVAHLETVRPRFPPGLRKIDESYYLHDAMICSMARRDQTLVMTLRLDTPPQSILTFVYDVVEDPVIIKDAVPQKCFGIGSIVEWQ